MKNILSGKRILVTSGPVWVPVDRVRVITNVFGGALGYIIAETAYRMGADVKLLLGPGRVKPMPDAERFKVVKFKYFDELLDLVKSEVSGQTHDIMIHSAAVADYTPVEVNPGKIKSGSGNLEIRLRPTIKIVDLVKKLDPSIFLVKFKLEVDAPPEALIEIAYNSMLASSADLIVANDFSTVSSEHQAFIIDRERNIEKITGKNEIAGALLSTVARMT